MPALPGGVGSAPVLLQKKKKGKPKPFTFDREKRTALETQLYGIDRSTHGGLEEYRDVRKKLMPMYRKPVQFDKRRLRHDLGALDPEGEDYAKEQFGLQRKIARTSPKGPEAKAVRAELRRRLDELEVASPNYKSKRDRLEGRLKDYSTKALKRGKKDDGKDDGKGKGKDGGSGVPDPPKHKKPPGYENDPLYDPGAILSGRDLALSAKDLARLETDPQYRAAYRELEQAQAQGTGLQTRSNAYFQQLAGEQGEDAERVASVGDRLAARLAGFGSAAQGQLTAAGEDADARLERDASLRGQGLEGGAGAALAAELQAQRARSAVSTQAAGEHGALQSAGLEGYGESIRATNQQRGGEVAEQLATQLSNQLNEIRGRIAQIASSEGPLTTKHLLDLRQSGFENWATAKGLKLDLKELSQQKRESKREFKLSKDELAQQKKEHADQFKLAAKQLKLDSKEKQRRFDLDVREFGFDRAEKMWRRKLDQSKADETGRHNRAGEGQQRRNERGRNRRDNGGGGKGPNLTSAEKSELRKITSAMRDAKREGKNGPKGRANAHDEIQAAIRQGKDPKLAKLAAKKVWGKKGSGVGGSV